MKHILKLFVVCMLPLLMTNCDPHNTKTQTGYEMFTEWSKDMDLFIGHIVEPTLRMDEYYVIDNVDAPGAPSPLMVIYEYFYCPISQIDSNTWSFTYKNTSMRFHHVYGTFLHAGSWETLLTDSVSYKNPFQNHTFSLEKPTPGSGLNVYCNDDDCQISGTFNANDGYQTSIYYTIYNDWPVSFEGKGIIKNNSVRLCFETLEPVVWQLIPSAPQWRFPDQLSNLNLLSGKLKLTSIDETGEILGVATITILENNRISIQMGNKTQEWQL